MGKVVCGSVHSHFQSMVGSLGILQFRGCWAESGDLEVEMHKGRTEEERVQQAFGGQVKRPWLWTLGPVPRRSAKVPMRQACGG